MEDYITTAEAARIKKVSRATIVRWINDGSIENVIRVNPRLWLVSRAEVLAYEPPPRGPKPKRGRPPKNRERDK